MKKLYFILFPLLTLALSFGCTPEVSKIATGTNVVQKFHREVKVVYEANYLLYLPDDYYQTDKK